MNQMLNKPPQLNWKIVHLRQNSIAYSKQVFLMLKDAYQPSDNHTLKPNPRQTTVISITCSTINKIKLRALRMYKAYTCVLKRCTGSFDTLVPTSQDTLSQFIKKLNV